MARAPHGPDNVAKAKPMNFDWSYVAAIGPRMITAAWTTLEVTVLSMALAAMLGLPIAAARISRLSMLSWCAACYVEAIRAVPILVLIYWVFFVLPLAGIVLDAFAVGVLALGVYYSTYAAEVFRAGIESVSKGQWEAALALNMTPINTLRRIILPQSMPAIVPPLGNYLVEMFKATPLLATIGMHELLGEGQQLAADSFRYAEVYLWVGVIFLALSYPSALVVRWLERRMAFRGNANHNLDVGRPIL